ncbi:MULTISPECIES: SMI1/KNR4 family protein [Streptomyces]|uniref:SMI1/KNR4 family protein n=1 Tax=Streptomyces sp. 900129855 TaxID=3155129 RepID=A0ABV2ZJK0_9ACTN
MTDIDGLVQRVTAKACIAEEVLPSKVIPGELEIAESSLGFTLPPLLARLYQEVANGCFGPGYRLFPLVGQGGTAVVTYQAERAKAAAADSSHWPEGVLPILDWGCGMYAAVDCLSEHGTVLLFEPNAVEDNWEDAWFVDADSLAAWLETWLADRGWYQEDAYDEEELPEPSPWASAPARLAGKG